MLLASRIKGGGELRGGCIALCKSKDLKQWTYEKPFYAPGMYITMECPEIFKMGNYWYLVFSTFSDQFIEFQKVQTDHGKFLKMMSLTPDQIMQSKPHQMDSEDLHLDGLQANMEIKILDHGNGVEQWCSMN